MSEYPCDDSSYDRYKGREDAGFCHPKILYCADPEGESEARAKYGKANDRIPCVW
jgi:hypothetical protein